MIKFQKVKVLDLKHCKTFKEVIKIKFHDQNYKDVSKKYNCSFVELFPFVAEM